MKKTVIIAFMLLFAVFAVSASVLADDEPEPVMDNATTAAAASSEDVKDAVEPLAEEGEGAAGEGDIAQSLALESIAGYEMLPYRSGNEAYTELADLWMGIKRALADNDTDNAYKQLHELQGRCLDFGITSFEDLSASIIKEGKVQLDIGNKEVALRLFETAARISPNYPPAYYAKGWGLFQHNKLKFLVALDSMIEGASKGNDNFWWSFYFTGNKFTSLLFTFAALFSLFGLFMAVRYSPLFAHDLAEKLNKKDQEHIIRYLAVPVVFLVILLLLGYWWAVIFTFLLLWVYFNKREKVLSILFFLLVVIMPSIMSHYANFIYASGNRTLWVIDEVNKGIIETGSEDYLLEMKAADSKNTMYRMSLAQIYKKQRRLDEAAAEYEELIKLVPESAIFRNNLGNVYLLSDRTDDAITQYEAAIKYEPKMALPLYNLSQAYAEKLMFTEREQSKNKASGLEPDLVDELIKRSGNTPYRFTFDELIPSEDLWALAMAETAESKDLAASLWSTMVKVMPLSGMSYAGIMMIVLLFLVNALRKKGNHSHYCDKCGIVSCPKCQRPHFSKDLCVQCYLTFVKMEGIEARDRVRKTIEIREKQHKESLLYRVSSLLMPGCGHFLSGRPLRGFVFSGLFLFFLKDIFFGSFLDYPYGRSLNVIGPDVVIMFVLMILVYITSQTDIYRLTMKK